MKNLLIFFLFGCISSTSFSQTDSTTPALQRLYGFYMRTGQTVVHTVAVQNIKGAKPYGFELQAASRRTDFTSWNKSGCFATTGFLLSYFHFNTPVLGDGMALSYFIQPEYRLGRHFTAYYKAGIGIDYLTKPNDVLKNPTNRSYSQHINPYMHVGIGFSYQPRSNIIVSVNGVFHHTSNGDFRKPNSGINWRTGGVGFLYTTEKTLLPKYKRNRSIHYTSRKTAVDAGFFYTPPQGYNPLRQSKRTVVGGLMAQVIQPFTNTNAIIGCISVHYMHYRLDGDHSVVDNQNPVMTGIHAGHAFLLGKLTFSQQIGVYLIKPAKFVPNVYEQWNLSYLFSRHWHLGVGLRSNSDNADFSDIKFLYRF